MSNEIEFFLLGLIFCRIFLYAKSARDIQRVYNKGFDAGVKHSVDSLKSAEAQVMKMPGGHIQVILNYPEVLND